MKPKHLFSALLAIFAFALCKYQTFKKTENATKNYGHSGDHFSRIKSIVIQNAESALTVHLILA